MRDRKHAQNLLRLRTSRAPARHRAHRRLWSAGAKGGSTKLPSSCERDNLRRSQAARSTHGLNYPSLCSPSSKKQLPDQRTRHSPGPAPPATSLARALPPNQHRKVPGVPFLQVVSSSITRAFMAILTSVLKESSRSCGMRAPRPIIRAGTSMLARGDKVQVMQTGPAHHWQLKRKGTWGLPSLQRNTPAPARRSADGQCADLGHGSAPVVRRHTVPHVPLCCFVDAKQHQKITR